MRTGRPPSWSDADVKTLHTGYAAKLTYNQICDTLPDITEIAVKAKIAREIAAGKLAPRNYRPEVVVPHNIERLRKLASEGKTNADIAAIIGKGERYVRLIASKFGLRESWVMWSDEKTAELKKLIDSDKSSSQVAKEMGLTRNEVVGRASRMGWKFIGRYAVKPKRHVPVGSPTQMGNKPKVLIVPPAEFDPTVAGVTIMGLEANMCKFPVTGSFSETLFCGDKQAPDCPYCAAHRAVCWTGQKMLGQPTRSLHAGRTRSQRAA